MTAVGIGLRAPHYRALAARPPEVRFLEVHSENFFGGGPPLAWLEHFRRDHALSLHGVGLALGSADPLDAAHLAKLAVLVRRIEPWLVSEHLCWGRVDGLHANELLPMPFTREAADHLVARIGEVQDALGRRVLVENVASYHRFAESTLEEAAFVAEVVQRAGCGLLLDVNNVFVNAANHGFDASAWLAAVPRGIVAEYHLAGHERLSWGLLDSHASAVSEPVWALYREALERLGPAPTLVEWDSRLPPLETLLGEARRAAAILEDVRMEAPA